MELHAWETKTICCITGKDSCFLLFLAFGIGANKNMVLGRVCIIIALHSNKSAVSCGEIVYLSRPKWEGE